MCGIYAILSRHTPGAGPGDEVFRQLDALSEDGDPRSLSSRLRQEVGATELSERLEALRRAAGRWMARDAFLALLGDRDLRERLRASLERVRRWVLELEAFSERGGGTGQTQREILNRLIVGGKDVVWQLENDVLGGLDPTRKLVAGGTSDQLARAYDLHLTLRGLDRLEVRGRDSAGLAVYAHFPGAGALDAFLDREAAGLPSSEDRGPDRSERLVHAAVLRPTSASGCLLFAFKVASEVGKMGDNVRALRGALVEDRLFQALLKEPEVDLQCLAHTRWASNGVISAANCHPVDSTVLRQGQPLAASVGSIVAVLNGDIDNYQILLERYVRDEGLEIPAAITTDAKIIPIVVAHHRRRTADLEGAFRRAVEELEGSMAIGLMSAERPGELLFAQKGSGQGLFFGAGAESIAVASEMYGVVELSPRYLKAEGELFRLRSAESDVGLELLDDGGSRPVPPERWKTAEITTRDINRGDFPHFFLKEISESVESVRKTLRGKFEVADGGPMRFLLGDEALPGKLVAGLREGRVERVCVIGQGTAAVAGQGVAHLLEGALQRSSHPLKVTAEKATEFSAHGLGEDMSDTLVVAVSQSGTTTDTNRTVDMARERGAWILSIVNRRNSDLVYKSHGVLYTSDGRDVEMSVASTKAFYAQNVAGQVLALTLAAALGTMTADEIARAVEDLRRLPDVMEGTLKRSGAIAELARKFALGRRHWAVVGSGAAKIAADEIRIKLSELCYKSIALDFLEDKKHIDLSSEPLVIVCAVGIPEEALSDTVKEVAILKAHNAVPLVITDEDESVFAPYSSGTIKLSRYRGALGFLPATMAGHLVGYHSAVSMDAVADLVRHLRAGFVGLQESRWEARNADESTRGFEDAAVQEIIERLPAAAAEPLRELDSLLAGGGLDAALGARVAVRLSRVLELFLGRMPIDGFQRMVLASGRVADTILAVLFEAIAELARPVDAIRHQAKTVTVGVSRAEATPGEGRLRRVLRDLGLSTERLVESHRIFLASFEPLVDSVEGVTLYRLSELDALGRPGERSRIVVERKSGVAVAVTSRCEAPVALIGNKWAVVKHREVYLGYGQSDRRKILIVPLVGERPEGGLLLFHLELTSGRDRRQRLRALAARGKFLDRLKAAVTERDQRWDPALMDRVDNETLFLEPPERVAEKLVEGAVSASS